MIATLAEPETKTAQEVLTTAFVVLVDYNSTPPVPPAVTFISSPPSDTVIIPTNTFTITLSREIGGNPPSTGATATFTTEPGGTNLVKWFDAGHNPIDQPGNIGTVSVVNGTLTIPITSNPANDLDPVIVSFMAFVICTESDGSGTVVIPTPDPTIVYVQPPG